MMGGTKRRPYAAILAGAIGGLVSGFVKLGWEVPFPPRPPGRIPEPIVLASMILHHPAPEWTSTVIHFTFSIVTGALYGLLVEFLPIVGIGVGAGYGIAVWIVAHEIVMPAIGLTPATWLLTAQEQVSEFFGHAIWGFTIEIFRRDLLSRWATRAAASTGARGNVTRAAR